MTMLTERKKKQAINNAWTFIPSQQSQNGHRTQPAELRGASRMGNFHTSRGSAEVIPEQQYHDAESRLSTNFWCF